jgi:predicted glutamine amidotransferase
MMLGMCRLFGFRSVIPSQVHRSLLSADNALGTQSTQHPDGWGVAFYVDGSPHVTRSPSTALNDQIFHRLSGVVAAETVMAHVRKATKGSIGVLNCHPFQYGRWTLAHNGDIPTFAETRAALVDLIAPRLRRYILGDTDSEVCFFLFLTELERRVPLTSEPSFADVAASLAAMDALVRRVADTPEQTSLLTFLVTNGTMMAASHGGKDLFYSTHKRRCSDRDTCSSLSPECESPRTSGRVNHFLVSSEPVLGENVWLPVAPGAIVGVDAGMNLHMFGDDRRRLPLAVA